MARISPWLIPALPEEDIITVLRMSFSNPNALDADFAIMLGRINRRGEPVIEDLDTAMKSGRITSLGFETNPELENPINTWGNTDPEMCSNPELEVAPVSFGLITNLAIPDINDADPAIIIVLMTNLSPDLEEDDDREMMLGLRVNSSTVVAEDEDEALMIILRTLFALTPADDEDVANVFGLGLIINSGDMAVEDVVLPLDRGNTTGAPSNRELEEAIRVGHNLNSTAIVALDMEEGSIPGEFDPDPPARRIISPKDDIPVAIKPGLKYSFPDSVAADVDVAAMTFGLYTKRFELFADDDETATTF